MSMASTLNFNSGGHSHTNLEKHKTFFDISQEIGWKLNFRQSVSQMTPTVTFWWCDVLLQLYSSSLAQCFSAYYCQHVLAPITHNRLHVFPRWAPVTRAGHPLHVFPRYAPVLCFPALHIRYMFYRTRLPLHVVPRLSSIPCFSALNIGWVFHRLTDTHFSQHFYWSPILVYHVICGRFGLQL